MSPPYRFYADAPLEPGKWISDFTLVSREGAVISRVIFDPVLSEQHQYVRAWGTSAGVIDKVELREWNYVRRALYLRPV